MRAALVSCAILVDSACACIQTCIQGGISELKGGAAGGGAAAAWAIAAPASGAPAPETGLTPPPDCAAMRALDLGGISFDQ